MSVLGGLAGGTLGSALGQAGGFLSAPRRALWSGISGLMGAETPESGAELMERLGVGDRSSLLSQLLGFTAEAATDPLTYVGAGIMPAIERIKRAKESLSLAPIAQGFQNVIDQEQALINATLKPQIGPQAQLMVNTGLDLPGIAAGQTRVAHDVVRGGAPRSPAWATTPDAAAKIPAAGLGELDSSGRLMTYGNQLPPNVSIGPAQINGKLAGKGPVVGQGGIPQEAWLAPGERQYLMDMRTAGMTPDRALPIAEDLWIDRLAKQIPPDPIGGARSSLREILSDMDAANTVLAPISDADWRKIALGTMLSIPAGTYMAMKGY